MSTIERAVEIAARGHSGQVDKQGRPYILHPLRVMDGVDSIEAKIVAVLHDVVEDTPTTFEDLAREGFSPAILDALRLVTHDPGEPYAVYVIRCKANPIARAVKLSDLMDNTRPGRVLMRPEFLNRDLARSARYALSAEYLNDRLSEESYRRAMAAVGELPER